MGEKATEKEELQSLQETISHYKKSTEQQQCVKSKQFS